jgi:hypothetical protein
MTNNYRPNSICPTCGKPYIYFGDEIGDNPKTKPYCTCNTKPKIGLSGWICPVCGAGLSPDTTICPCTHTPFKVTC